jgi:DNA-binding transcriptional LysR family regulator
VPTTSIAQGRDAGSFRIGTVTDLRRLQYFVAVARERNFTRAAERLHIAQPALSRQVRLLEQELGVELLHRTTHEFELTAAGALLLDRGPTVLASAEELWRDVRAYGTGERGRLLVAYGASASYETAPRLLRALAERHPGVELATAVKSVDEIVSGLSAGSVDVGIVRCPPRTPDLECRTIRQEGQRVLLRDGHPLADAPVIAVQELAPETLLMHPREANPGHYDAIVDLCRSAGFEPQIRLRSVSFDLAYSSIADSDVVAIIGESSSVGLPDGLRLVALDPPVAIEVSLLVRRHNRSPVVDRILETLPAVTEELGWA